MSRRVNTNRHHAIVSFESTCWCLAMSHIRAIRWYKNAMNQHNLQIGHSATPHSKIWWKAGLLKHSLNWLSLHSRNIVHSIMLYYQRQYSRVLIAWRLYDILVNSMSNLLRCYFAGACILICFLPVQYCAPTWAAQRWLWSSRDILCTHDALLHICNERYWYIWCQFLTCPYTLMQV